jgi:serine/threonine-protein kinase RsbW
MEPNMESLTFPGDLEALAPIRDFVEEAAKQAGLDKKAIYDLVLAVDEIATNVVTHGYEEAGLKGDIKIDAEITPERLVIHLRDRGLPYDPSTYSVPTSEDLSRPLEERNIGGLGILLARAAVDELNYKDIDSFHVHEFVIRRERHG